MLLSIVWNINIYTQDQAIYEYVKNRHYDICRLNK